jgi:hypothetical protein
VATAVRAGGGGDVGAPVARGGSGIRLGQGSSGSVGTKERERGVTPQDREKRGYENILFIFFAYG